MVALSDLNQPYSCSQWGNVPNGGASQIIHDTGYDIWELFETGSAFPSTVWLDHEMRVHDQMNNAGSWSIGIRMDEMLEACGSLCEEDGGCTTSAGDVNEDETLNIQDLITLVNTILGSARSEQLNGYAEIKYVTSGNDLIIQIASDVDLAGIQLSLTHDTQLDVELKDNSHINQDSHFQNGTTQYLAYSMFNQPYDSKTTELLIHSAGNLDMNDVQIIVADVNGDALNLSHSQGGRNYQSGPHSFELSRLYPNPFNPSTEVSFSLPMDNHVRLAAYDVRGKEVDVIFEGAQSIGSHSYTWNASNLPSGVYYIRLQAGAMVTSQKALLIK